MLSLLAWKTSAMMLGGRGVYTNNHTGNILSEKATTGLFALVLLHIRWLLKRLFPELLNLQAAKSITNGTMHCRNLIMYGRILTLIRMNNTRGYPDLSQTTQQHQSKCHLIQIQRKQLNIRTTSIQDLVSQLKIRIFTIIQNRILKKY